MADHTTVYCRKNSFQRPTFLRNFFFISPLLGYVDCHPHSTHDASVNIIKRGFVCGKRPQAFACLNNLLRHTGLFPAHNLLFRLNTGRVVLLHIPYVSMTPSFYLFLCLINSFTETVVYLFMNSILVLIPNQIRRSIDRRLKKVAGLPVVFAFLVSLLPAQKAESHLIVRHGCYPYIPDF